MSHQSHMISNIVRNYLIEGLFRLIFLAGGVKSPLLRYFLNLESTFVAAVDNPYEIDLLKHQFRGKNLHTFAVGVGHTTWSVHQDSPPGMRQAAFNTANTSMGVGSGARIANASRAAELLVVSESFQAMLESLPEQAEICTGSRLKYIDALFLYSTSGAIGAGSIPIVAPPILQALSKFGCIVNARFNALGPTTFAGISKRARKTSASALVSNVRMILDSSDLSTVRIPKSLEIHNLGPFQDNVKLRSECLLLDTVYSEAIQMEQYRNMETPNHANDDRFGTITSRTVDFMSGLDRLVDIAGQSASNLLVSMTDRLTGITPDPRLIEDQQWLDASVDLDREDISDVIDRLGEVDDELLLIAITRPAARNYFQLKLITPSYGEFVLEHLSTNFATTPQSASEYEIRLHLLASFRNELDGESAIVRELLQEVDLEIDELQESIAKWLRKVTQGRFSPTQKHIDGLEKAAHKLREYSDRKHLLAAEENALMRATTVVQHEWELHVNRIDEMRTILHSHVPKGTLKEEFALVATSGLDEAFRRALTLPQISRDEQIDVLSSMATAVSLHGLQRCVNADDDRLDSIAPRIVYGNYTIQSPGHGDRVRPSESDKVMYSLPPMEPQLETQLEEEIRNLQPDAKVTFYDTLTFGAAVMRIRIQRFSRLEDIFGGLTGEDLIDSVRDPLAGLNSPDGFKSLEQLGMRVEGNRLIFPDEQRISLLNSHHENNSSENRESA